MTTIAFDNPTGLSPIIGDFVPSATISRVCQAYLRKRDIRPYSHPQSTNRVVQSNRAALVQNPTTGTMHAGGLGSSIIPDGWNGTKLVYAVLDGVATLREGDTVVGDFTPPRATSAPVITQRTLPSTTGTNTFDATLAAVASAQTPVNNLGLDTPWFIRFATSGSAYITYPLSEIQRAINWVLDNYKVTYANGVIPMSLRYCLNTLLTSLNSSTPITRYENDTKYTYQRNASTTKHIHDAIAGFTTTLGSFVLEALKGNFSQQVSIRVCPLDYNGSSDVCPYLAVTVTADPTAYTPSSTGVPTYNTTGEVLVTTFNYCSRVWSSDYSLSTPLTAIDQALVELQTAYANPSTYVWNGLTASQFTSLGELQTYNLGSETMRSDEQVDIHNLLRGYCYTFVDAYGREGQPSLSTFVDDSSLDTRYGVARHSFTLPTNIPPYTKAIKLYRAVAPKDVKSIDDVAWLCVATYAIPNGATQFDIPTLDVASYDTLDTLNDSPVYAPKFLCVTGTDHAVCIEDGAVCFSKRHKFYSFPYDRRIELPLGINALTVKAVDNIVYVGTDSCPMVIVIGEDHGDEGLQLEETLLRHAPYGVAAVGSFTTTPFGVMYWSKVGVVVLAGKNVSIATASIIDEDQVPTYLPNTAVYQNGMYLSFGDDVCTVLDVPDPTFAEQVQAPMTQAAVGAKAACLGIDGLVYLAPTRGYTCKVWDMTGGIPMNVHYKTYNQLLPSDTVFHAARVYGSCVSGTLLGYDEGGLLFEVEVDNSRPVRLPRHIAKNYISLEFLGDAACISKMVVASAMEELM